MKDLFLGGSTTCRRESLEPWCGVQRRCGCGECGVQVRCGCGELCGTRGLGVLSSSGDVLEMSVMRGVGGVCDMCICLAQGAVGGVGGERIGLYQSWRNRGSGICVCVFVALVWVVLGGGGSG